MGKQEFVILVNSMQHALRSLEDEVRRLTEHNKQMHYALALIATGKTDPVKIAQDAMRDLWGKKEG